MDDCEEEIRNGSNVLASAVHQREGDDQPVFTPEAAVGPRPFWMREGLVRPFKGPQ
jgi:hypothetical protein